MALLWIGAASFQECPMLFGARIANDSSEGLATGKLGAAEVVSELCSHTVVQYWVRSSRVPGLPVKKD
jgi:hypothetical protein